MIEIYNVKILILKETLTDLQNNNFNNNELKLILNNIKNTIKYSKEIIKNK